MKELSENLKKKKRINAKEMLRLAILILIFSAVVYFVNSKKINQETLFKYEIRLLVDSEKFPDAKFASKGNVEIYDNKVRAVIKNISTIKNLYDNGISNENTTTNGNKMYFEIEMYILVNRRQGAYWYVYDQELAKGDNLTISVGDHKFTGEVIYGQMIYTRTLK